MKQKKRKKLKANNGLSKYFEEEVEESIGEDDEDFSDAEMNVKAQREMQQDLYRQRDSKKHMP